MSTTQVTAGQIMDRVANLLNDPNKTDYNYTVMLPYLNMAIEEFSDLMVEVNHTFFNLTNTNHLGPIYVPVGISSLLPPEHPSPTLPKYPIDMIEIQEIGERPQGDAGPFRRLPRREFPEIFPITNSFLFWVWERGVIRFNAVGATVPMEVEMKYVYQGINYATDPNSVIIVVGARTYLAYKTAALCAMFIGENETRAAILETQAEKAIERTITISNKGRQQIMTRHRPFRAAWKARSGF